MKKKIIIEVDAFKVEVYKYVEDYPRIILNREINFKQNFNLGLEKLFYVFEEVKLTNPEDPISIDATDLLMELKK